MARKANKVSIEESCHGSFGCAVFLILMFVALYYSIGNPMAIETEVVNGEVVHARNLLVSYEKRNGREYVAKSRSSIPWPGATYWVRTERIGNDYKITEVELTSGMADTIWLYEGDAIDENPEVKALAEKILVAGRTLYQRAQSKSFKP